MRVDSYLMLRCSPSCEELMGGNTNSLTPHLEIRREDSPGPNAYGARSPQARGRVHQLPPLRPSPVAPKQDTPHIKGKKKATVLKNQNNNQCEMLNLTSNRMIMRTLLTGPQPA
uniref:Uncharacterized protein n=1 Tax=Sphaerodactylus townsendi TaxID=933632 RepID=A0ACB8ESK2_9SAUR